ncbi:MAG: hypothetical protein NC223_10955 [Butyrivibrio sp.]|nr:hypothetical protein [Butyrivibrio sp.]
MSFREINELKENYAILTVHGQREAYVENFKAIMELGSAVIKIRALKEILVFEGSGLFIEYMNSYDIKIVGCIEHIRILEVS